MKIMTATASIAAALLLVSGCAADPGKEPAGDTAQSPQDAEFNDDTPGTGGGSAGEAEIQPGGLQGEFGKIVQADDVDVAMRVKGTDIVADYEPANAGETAHGFELQVENQGDTNFDASNSFVTAVSTDKGSGERVDNVVGDPAGFLEQIGPGTKASMTVYFVLPEGATKATVSAQVGGIDDYVDVTFSGNIDSN